MYRILVSQKTLPMGDDSQSDILSCNDGMTWNAHVILVCDMCLSQFGYFLI